MAQGDPATQSNYLEITTIHVEFEWKLDFSQQVISGSALHNLVVQPGSRDVTEVIFDTKDLEVHSIDVNGVQSQGKFTLKPRHPVMGSALHVQFPTALKSGDKVDVKIHYNTKKELYALQWLEKEQTKGNKFPFLFSQCQPIHARTIAPLQDTPSVKLTYSSKVTSVLPALMSAVQVDPLPTGPPHAGKEIGKDEVTYSFSLPTAIPSYLIAIASGNLVFKPFEKLPGKDWTTGVWAEPETIDAAHWEFREDTARFLAAEENLVTPYKFGVYNLLVLPPSFPYGGMENSCLSFLTPSLLAGDRTLVDVVVHELTHSWFGNGVTHQHASHFWLNEGWTTYIERVLQQILHTPAHRGFSYLIGSKALQDALEQYASFPKYQRMIVEYEAGEDPDDAYSSIPYEKGANLLLHLEEKLGGLEVFLPYVKDYVNTFMGKSTNTDQWKKHLFEYWRKNGGDEKVKALESVDWNGWFFGEGLKLPVEMKYDSTLATQAFDLAKSWDKSRDIDPADLSFKSTDLNEFDSNQKAVFLERLQSYDPLPSPHLGQLGSLYGLDKTTNAELRFRYYQVVLMNPKTPDAETFVKGALKWVVGEDGSGIIQGRMKFCRPVFRATARADYESTNETFVKHKDAFHPIARGLIEKDLKNLEASKAK